MAEKTQSSIEFEKKLWDAACVLWGHIPAAEYRKVIIGLIFLRYVSNAFEIRYNELVSEGEGFEDDRDAYEEKNVFYVPEEARWSKISAAAHSPEIGLVIDNAMRAIENDNISLKNVLPKNYANPDLDKLVLGDVVDIFTNMVMGNDSESQDLLGRTYEYCLSKFAEKEGANGGEFYTPSSVVKTLVEVLQPYNNCRVYDPACGSGGMFVQSAKFIASHSGTRGGISIYGQEANPDTWKMAKMNMAIRGIDADFGPCHADTFGKDLHPQLKADFILANPPFNYHPWGQEKLKDDVRWKYGVPPASNANFAWIQHMIHHLSPRGKIGLVLANTSLSICNGDEYEIRKKIIEDNLVEAIVSLPASLFYSTKIKVSIWFISKIKTTSNILFIDARKLGHHITRTMKEFSDTDIESIANVVHEFSKNGKVEKIAGFCNYASLDDVREKNYNISPSKYVAGSIEVDEIDDFDLCINDDVDYISKRTQEYCNGNNYYLFDSEFKTKSFDQLIESIVNLDNDSVNQLLKDSDTIITKRKEVIEKLNESNDRLFKYWFIDFNFSNTDGNPYALNGGEMKETEYGLVPLSWRVIPLGDILTGSSAKVGQLEGIPEYSTTNLGVFPRAAKFNKTLSSNSSKNKLIHQGDIVFGMSREIFNFGVMKDCIGSVSPAYHVYNIDNSVMNSEFLEIYMRICSEYFLSLIKPGTREGQVLDKDELNRKLILCPPIDLQEKYMIIRKYASDWLI